jgi:hypothetical protein
MVRFLCKGNDMGYGIRGESGEKLPKGVMSSDKSGMKKGSESGPNSLKGIASTTGAKAPAGATASDMSGERKAKLVGGVAMGKADGIGARDASHMGKNDGMLGECKGGSREHTVYEHKRVEHHQDKM